MTEEETWHELQRLLPQNPQQTPVEQNDVESGLRSDTDVGGSVDQSGTEDGDQTGDVNDAVSSAGDNDSDEESIDEHIITPGAGGHGDTGDGSLIVRVSVSVLLTQIILVLYTQGMLQKANTQSCEVESERLVEEGCESVDYNWQQDSNWAEIGPLLGELALSLITMVSPVIFRKVQDKLPSWLLGMVTGLAYTATVVPMLSQARGDGSNRAVGMVCNHASKECDKGALRDIAFYNEGDPAVSLLVHAGLALLTHMQLSALITRLVRRMSGEYVPVSASSASANSDVSEDAVVTLSLDPEDIAQLSSEAQVERFVAQLESLDGASSELARQVVTLQDNPAATNSLFAAIHNLNQVSLALRVELAYRVATLIMEHYSNDAIETPAQFLCKEFDLDGEVAFNPHYIALEVRGAHGLQRKLSAGVYPKVEVVRWIAVSLVGPATRLRIGDGRETGAFPWRFSNEDDAQYVQRVFNAVTVEAEVVCRDMSAWVFNEQPVNGVPSVLAQIKAATCSQNSLVMDQSGDLGGGDFPAFQQFRR